MARTPATQVAAVYNSRGILVMIINPDTQEELDDPAFNRPGFRQVRFTKAEYSTKEHEQLIADAHAAAALAGVSDPRMQIPAISLNRQVAEVQAFRDGHAARLAAIQSDILMTPAEKTEATRRENAADAAAAANIAIWQAELARV
jgi:hypothetical protein